MDVLSIEIGDVHAGDVIVDSWEGVGPVKGEFLGDVQVAWFRALIVGDGDVNGVANDAVDMNRDVDRTSVSRGLEGVILSYDGGTGDGDRVIIPGRSCRVWENKHLFVSIADIFDGV